MRESRTFGERSIIRNDDTPARKYFLVFEGTDTEPLYFKAVNNARQTLGISPLIELIHIERCRGEEGWSNPKLILDTLSDNLAERDGTILTYSTLLNAMVDCLYTSEYIKKRGAIISEIWTVLKTHCENKLGHSLRETVEDRESAVNEILEVIKETRPRINDIILENLQESIQARQITYSEEQDKLCFIFDRDKRSFTYKQYTAVIEKCQEKNITAYSSNPCFEFWLLLHYDEVHDLDKEKLLSNQKIGKSKNAKTYTTQQLKELMGYYTKSNYNADMLMERISVAIENEKRFCENIEELENQLGSTVGLLLTDILSK